MKKILIVLFFVFSQLTIMKAQDIHFSQFYNDISYENPSYTGNYEGLSKINFINRDQWRSVSVPYKTFYFGFENKIKILSGALGFNFFQDKSGDLNLKTNQFNLTYSGSFNISKSTFFLGVYSGIGQLKIDYSNLSLLDYETFSISSVNYLDLGLGIKHDYNLNEKILLENSFSFSHINSPLISLSSNSENNLSAKYIYKFKMTYSLLYDNIVSCFKIVDQGDFSKIEIGSFYRINTPLGYSFSPGIGYRNKDAVILHFGFNSKNYAVDFLYDLNVSNLSNASNYKGGIELGFVYLFGNKKNVEFKKHICPDYL
tara:strand:+ start:660 stop:1601 length:942 start_codon:yes stop_codon:yes gene_type:complete